MATHRNVFYGADALAHTARLVIDTDSTDPPSLLAGARGTRPGLSRLLVDFFHAHHLLDAPADVQSTRAATRRERRIEAVPAPLRPAVRAFAEVLVARRENAERLGLRPNQLKTIEIRLDTVRDLALYLHAKGQTTWAGVNATDLEAFLARNPARRASWLAGLRQFFSHAHCTGVVLHDAAAAIQAPQPRGFSGSTLALDEQRALYRRWSAGEGVLPHEAFIGLAALLHAATTTELRHLTLVDIGTASRTVRFPGRGVDLALDDATWRALEGCLAHRRALHTDNPHLLVTRLTRVATCPAGAAHIRDSLAPVGLLPRTLRSTRLLALADELDVKQLTVALGMSYGGTAHYR
ncbi:integrase [Streptomyces vinaceus]|uniref:integrase n=1 Tax=Streptomyces vinaceus TaxID=1960 RepID=UPI0037FBB98A